MNNKKILAIAVSAFSLTLAACGGSSSNVADTDDLLENETNEYLDSDSDSSSGNSNASVLNLMVMDDLSLQYDKVWVTLLQVSANYNGGETVVLYDAEAGDIINLTELDNIGSLLASQSLDPGTYSNIRVLLDRAVILEDMNGNVTSANFDSADTYELAVAGSFELVAAQTATLALDFDLSQFNHDASTGIVSPVVVLRQQQELQSLDRSYAEIEGLVTAVSDTGFTMQPEHSSQTLEVGAGTDMTVTDESSSSVRADFSALSIGDRVEVYGEFTIADSSLAARSVRIENSTGEDSDNNLSDWSERTEIEGYVTAWDANSRSLTVDIRDSDILFTSSTLTLVIGNEVLFSRGSESMLASGQRIEIKGNWDGSNFSASLIEIESAPSNASHDEETDHDSDDGIEFSYAEVEGTVISYSTYSLQLLLTDAEHLSLAAGTELTADLTDAWFKEGSAAELTSGVHVELKGSLQQQDDGSGGTANVFVATVVEVDSEQYDSGDDHSDDSDSDDSHDYEDSEHDDDDSGDESEQDDLDD